MKDHAPIKRHQALVALSKDHHYGLLLVWKIRQGLRNAVNTQRISSYVLFFFEEDLQRHFNEEEKDLFGKLPATDPLTERAITEHRKIYNLVSAIKQDPENSDLLADFAGMLESHIRFEERELFNYLQKTLPAKELETLALQANREKHNPDDKWNDWFWEKEKPGRTNPAI